MIAATLIKSMVVATAVGLPTVQSMLYISICLCIFIIFTCSLVYNIWELQRAGPLPWGAPAYHKMS